MISSKQRQGYDAPEGLLRYGPFQSSEIRFTLPDYYQNYFSNGRYATGLGDLGTGFKQSFAATKRGFNLAAIAALTFPTGTQSVSSHGYDPTIQIMPSQKLPSGLSMAGMFSVAWPTENQSRNTTGDSSVVLDWQPAKPMDLFVEYAGSFPGRGTPQHTIEFGGLYRLTGRQQEDFRAGVGLSSAATNSFMGIGYSIRFDL